MELKTLTELNVTMPVTCVKLQVTDAAITDPVVVTVNKVKPIRADHFGNVLKNSSGDYCAARSSEKLLLCHCKCCYKVNIPYRYNLQQYYFELSRFIVEYVYIFEIIVKHFEVK